jgi:predicted component of type VI protein secretion system
MPNRTLEQRFADHEERLAHVEVVVEKQSKELDIQFKRIAQLQAELDQKRVATDNVKVVIEPFAEKSD